MKSEWIMDMGEVWICRNCGEPCKEHFMGKPRWNYCPWCGADMRAEQTEPKWTKENCKGCKYNKYPYDESTCFVRVCINGNKYEPTTEDCSMVDPLHDDCFDCDKFFTCDNKGDDYKTDCPWK